MEQGSNQRAGPGAGAGERDSYKEHQTPESKFLNLSFVLVGFLANPDGDFAQARNAFHDIQNPLDQKQNEWDWKQVSNDTDGNGPQNRNI